MNIFEKLIENLRQFQEDIENFEVEYRPDEDGYLDLECPKKSCTFEFKIHADDASNLFRRKVIYCPRCKNKSGGNQYYPTSFIDKTRDELVTHFRSALFEDTRMPKQLTPFESTEAWRQKITCEECKTKYSVVGVAFFCPFCGYNSVNMLFKDSIAKIQLKAKVSSDDLKVINSGITRDEVEQLLSSLKESCLTDCVTAFEHFAKFYFEMRCGRKAKRNVFQRVMA